MKSVFITWYPTCRRSDSIAHALAGKSYLVHYLRFKQPLYAPFKYLLQWLKTWQILLAEKPDVVLVASPPVFSVLCVAIYCRLWRKPYVVDAHTGMFDDRRWTWLSPLSRYLSRRATTTIVTNPHLASIVESWRAHATVIGDVPVSFPTLTASNLGVGDHLVVVNTFSEDEPLAEILDAAMRIREVTLHITGNPNHSRLADICDVPENVRFTGWLTEDGYAELLMAADVVMCLTTHDHTMQRGAYEAMALGKPLITSNWSLLKGTFDSGTIHVDNTPPDISRAVRQALDNRTNLGEEMQGLAKRRAATFDNKISALKCLLCAD